MLKKSNAWVIALFGVFAFTRLALAEPPVPESLRLAFYPYSSESPYPEGITPGATIDQHNWQIAEPLLPPEVLQLVHSGDFTISVQETTDLPVRTPYITATAEHFPSVALDSGSKIEHYQGARPIFELYGIEDEIQRALQRRVELKSGGHLVIDQTEAMTTADVNTGGFVGHRNLEETIFKTNLEAAQTIARQLRLRNLGGIIIVDFIDMQNPEHCRQVMRALEKHLERDHSKTTISDMSALGLVQITRKRTRESLEHVLCEPCPACRGRGTVKTAETVCFEVFREILREARQYDAKQLLVVAAPLITNMLLEEESASVAELEAFIGIPIRVQAEVSYTQEQYDVVLV